MPDNNTPLATEALQTLVTNSTERSEATTTAIAPPTPGETPRPAGPAAALEDEDENEDAKKRAGENASVGEKVAPKPKPADDDDEKKKAKSEDNLQELVKGYYQLKAKRAERGEIDVLAAAMRRFAARIKNRVTGVKEQPAATNTATNTTPEAVPTPNNPAPTTDNTTPTPAAPTASADSVLGAMDVLANSAEISSNAQNTPAPTPDSASREIADQEEEVSNQRAFTEQEEFNSADAGLDRRTEPTAPDTSALQELVDASAVLTIALER